MGKFNKNVMSLQVHLHRRKFQFSPNSTLARILKTFPSPMQLLRTAGPRSAPNDQKKSIKSIQNKAIPSAASNLHAAKKDGQTPKSIIWGNFLDIHRYLQNSEKCESPNTSFCSLFYKLKWNKLKWNTPFSPGSAACPYYSLFVSCFRVFCLWLSHMKWPPTMLKCWAVFLSALKGRPELETLCSGRGTVGHDLSVNGLATHITKGGLTQWHS